MLRILRQLTAEELRKAAVHASAGPGATPEEIIRALSRACGAHLWGLFPATTDDVLLDHVGRRLGMPPLIGGPRGVPERERAIFCCYLRQAWHAADPARRWTILHAAIEAWDTGTVPPPLPPGDPDDTAACEAVFETLLQTPAGLRALAMATETAAMPLPGPEPMFGPIAVRFGHAGSGHQALYAVLRLLWRARSRLLRERRTQLTQLQRQQAQAESLLTVRRRNLTESGTHWALNPANGLSLTAAAGASVAIHAALAAATPFVLVPAAVVGAAGLAWSVSALAARPRALTNPRTAQLHSQIHSLRSQLDEVSREVSRLERE